MSLYYVNGGFITHTLCNNFTAILQITLYLGKKVPLLCMVSSRWHYNMTMIYHTQRTSSCRNHDLLPYCSIVCNRWISNWGWYFVASWSSS